jgi:hypothetical protein
LGFVQPNESFDALDLNYDAILDYEVRTMLADETPFVEHRNADLSVEMKSGIFEFEANGDVIGVLEQAWAQFAMNFYRASDDAMCQRVMFVTMILGASLPRCVVV